MVPFSWRHWLHNLIGPAHKTTRKPGCRLAAELLEDRRVPSASPVLDIYVVGVTGVTNSVHAGKPVFTDATRFNDGRGDPTSVQEIGTSNIWVAPTLRSAVAFANANPGSAAQPDVILLETTAAAKPYLVTQGEIDFDFSDGALVVKNKANGISTIDARHQNRIFADYGGGVVTLDHLKLTDGSAYGGDAQGAAIDNFGTMILTNDQFVNNQVSTTPEDEGDPQPQGGAIFNGGAMTLSNDLFTGNQAAGGTAYGGAAYGGALYNEAGDSLSITNSNFTNNTAQGDSHLESNSGVDAGGGAIYIEGDETNTISITGTTFNNNKAIGGSFSGGEGSSTSGGAAHGGAIDCGESGGDKSVTTLNLTGCTFNGNTATGGAAHNAFGSSGYGGTGYGGTGYGGDAYGGALYADINANIVNSTFANNKAIGGLGQASDGVGYGGNAFGGAINGSFTNENTINLVNDTIAFNSAVAGQGLGMAQQGPTSHNPGIAYGGGVAAIDIGRTEEPNVRVSEVDIPLASMNVVNTIIAKNSATTGGANVVGDFDSAGHNLIGSADANSIGFINNANGDQVGTVAHPIDPGLDPRGLQNNGGPTLTIALIPSSRAINKGDNAFGGFIPAPTTDQRGLARIVGPAVDIGAVEMSNSVKRGRDALGLFAMPVPGMPG